MSKELEIFIGYLKKKGLKLTVQRKIMLDVFLKTERHLSVEGLYNIAKKKDKSIGQATVFRTLKVLQDAGIAKEVDIGDGKKRYERQYGREHHDHLICVKCGVFIEAVDPRIEKLQDELCRKHGFKPQRHKMEIFGVCKKCR
ncbi:MAG: transcriptional repressor [Candidatus Omnitrophica bacterium]|nr:transcriptional repressor [Candidatus Omnitrophota bacterium]